MKILHTVEFYPPSVGGMQEVVKQLSERLVRLGHEVTVATRSLPNRDQAAINGVKIAEFELSGNLTNGFVGDTTAYEKFLLGNQFDIVTNFAAQQWATDIALPLLKKIHGKKVFVPTGFSGLYVPRYKQYFAQMPTWLKAYDHTVFLSNDYRDINFAREHGLKTFSIIPNGAGADEFLPRPKHNIRKLLRIPEHHTLILHVGSHTGAKGHAEAIDLFKQADITNVTFLIIGNIMGRGCSLSCQQKALFARFSPRLRQQNKQLLVRDLSRDITVAAYKQADLFLFPSNIECSPLVLFEAMAAKLPFLTTDAGNAKEIIAWSHGGMLLPTEKNNRGNSRMVIDQSLPIFERLVKNKNERKQLGEHGFAAWDMRFSWEKITNEYETLYTQLLNEAV